MTMMMIQLLVETVDSGPFIMLYSPFSQIVCTGSSSTKLYLVEFPGMSSNDDKTVKAKVIMNTND